VLDGLGAMNGEHGGLTKGMLTFLNVATKNKVMNLISNNDARIAGR
jgi:hypothetical protein